MNKYWFTLFCTIFVLVYGLFCWHLIRWNDPYHGTYSLNDEKEIVFHVDEKIKEKWNLEQCGHLKGVYIPCERPVITVPVPSTLWLAILFIIPLIIRFKHEH